MAGGFKINSLFPKLPMLYSLYAFASSVSPHQNCPKNPETRSNPFPWGKMGQGGAAYLGGRLPHGRKNQRTGQVGAGTRTILGGEFRLAYKQGLALLEGHPDITEHPVFIRVLSDLKPGSVKAKIAGELKNRTDQGSFICFFEHTGELFNWTYKELKSIIGV
jgi:hypothetical protein